MGIKINLHKIDAKMTLKSSNYQLIVFNSEKSELITKSLKSKIKRKNTTIKDLTKESVTIEDENSNVIVYLYASNLEPYKRQTLIRKSLKNILDENPEQIT